MSRLMLPCWLLLACGEKEPCWGLEKGHTYFVDVLSAYGPESEYTWDPSVGVDLPSCGLNLDVQVGTTLGFKIVEQVDAPAGSPCLKSGAQVSGLTDAFEIPAGIGALGPSIDRTGPVTIASGAKINGCVGSWGMALLDVGAGAPFAAPFPGEPPLLYSSEDSNQPRRAPSVSHSSAICRLSVPTSSWCTCERTRVAPWRSSCSPPARIYAFGLLGRRGGAYPGSLGTRSALADGSDRGSSGRSGRCSSV